MDVELDGIGTSFEGPLKGRDEFSGCSRFAPRWAMRSKGSARCMGVYIVAACGYSRRYRDNVRSVKRLTLTGRTWWRLPVGPNEQSGTGQG
jgi:hypothetical protein